MTEQASGPTDEQVVEVAAAAAEDVIFSRFRRSKLTDVDVAVRFSDGVLDVDVYLNGPNTDGADLEEVADDAALAARTAVDDLFVG